MFGTKVFVTRKCINFAPILARVGSKKRRHGVVRLTGITVYIINNVRNCRH